MPAGGEQLGGFISRPVIDDDDRELKSREPRQHAAERPSVVVRRQDHRAGKPAWGLVLGTHRGGYRARGVESRQLGSWREGAAPQRAVPLWWMNGALYSICMCLFRGIKWCCIRERVVRREEIAPHGPVLLAVSHLSHLEPAFVMAQVGRPVHWMTRVEFFGPRWAAMVLNGCGAFPVDRAGFALPAIRKAIGLLGEGRVVGVFPEGGVVSGRDSVLRGGPIKEGICTIAIRTGVPIVPVMVLGTEDLNRVSPWLPARRGSVCVVFGNPVVPPASRRSNRRTRAELSGQLRGEFVRLFRLQQFESGAGETWSWSAGERSLLQDRP